MVIAVGSYISSVYSVDLIKKYNEKSLKEQFSQSDYNIQSMMREVDRLSMMFTIDGNVQNLLQENYGSSQFEIVMNNKNVLNAISNYLTNYSYLDSIYLLLNNGGEIGSNSLTTVNSAVADRSALLTPRVYQAVQNADPKFYWSGGKKASTFAPQIKDENNRYLITAYRRVKPNYQLSKNAILIFNIDEGYLASLYGNYDAKNEYTYIVDQGGTIISSVDGKGIGSKSLVTSCLNQTDSYGSYTSEVSQNQMQIVYYRMSITGWVLVRAIPYATFEGDAIALQKNIEIVFGLSMLVVIVVSSFWLKRMTKPLKMLAGKMADVGSGNLGITFARVPKNEFGIVIQRFNEMSVNIKNLVQENNQMAAERRNLEIEALQYQINPHFLYNTLNMIKWMAGMIHAQNIVECIITLGNIIRPVYKSRSSSCTVGEEIDYIHNYLKIMNWRYGNLIRFGAEISEDVMDCRIPRFILQPVVENCVIHGITDDNPIEITIRISQQKGALSISVADDGVGMDGKTLDQINEKLSNSESQPEKVKSVGLPNVFRRLFLSYGKECSMYLKSSEGKGTTVYLSMPAVHGNTEGTPENFV